MPATSKEQQMAAGAALAAKQGKRPKSSLKGASKQMEKSMSEKQLKDFAKQTQEAAEEPSLKCGFLLESLRQLWRRRRWVHIAGLLMSEKPRAGWRFDSQFKAV